MGWAAKPSVGYESRVNYVKACIVKDDGLVEEHGCEHCGFPLLRVTSCPLIEPSLSAILFSVYGYP